MRYWAFFFAALAMLGLISGLALSCSKESQIAEKKPESIPQPLTEPTSKSSPEPTPLPSLASHPSGEGSLKLEVVSTIVANSFPTYMGGGTNIRPPAPLPIHGGGIPMLSMSKNEDGSSSSFMAAITKAPKETDRLIKVTCKIENSFPSPQSFKVGDVSLLMGSIVTNDFVAVGLGDVPCAMSAGDRTIVKEKAIEVQPNGDITITYVFNLPDSVSKQGALALGKAAPVPFKIDTKSSK